MKEVFVPRKFTAESQATLAKVNSILAEYERQGYKLTLRQLYYQLVARDFISNNLRSYKNLGNLVSNARQAGLIDWAMIEDRGRSTTTNPHWSSPAAIVEAAAYSYRIDKWYNQSYHVEVMVEKDALSGVLNPVCRQLDIGITADKGYISSSTMYDIGQRLALQASFGKQILVLYLGDHDPSGIDMTRDVKKRLLLYSRLEDEDTLQVERLALNWDQVQIWQPPENPAKETDARFAAYKELYGKSCWELDAVEPRTLADLVRQAVARVRDEDAWKEAVKLENEGRAELQKFVESYEARNNGSDEDSEEDDEE